MYQSENKNEESQEYQIGEEYDSDDQKHVTLKFDVIPQPIQSLFESQIQSIPESEQEQPDQELTVQLDLFLDFVSSNEIILNQRNTIFEEEETIDETFDQFEFREYQMDLFEKGKGKNSIIYLETGLGKTLVIIMLMWQRMLQFPNKKVIFLANTIQLVEQQANQIKKKLPRVAEILQDEEEYQYYAKKLVKDLQILHGSKCTDMWNTKMWDAIFQQYQLFVMTSQLFLNLLRKGQLNINNICFIAMDECHSATQDHPYNNILREFYFPARQEAEFLQKCDELPQIVGATASPITTNKVVNDEQIMKELVQLAANMDSIYIYSDLDSVRTYLKEAQIKQIPYKVLFDDPDIQQVVEFRADYSKCQKSIPRVFDVIKKNNYLIEFFKLSDFLQIEKEKYNQYLKIQVLIKRIERIVFQSGFQMYLELGQFIFSEVLIFVVERMKDYYRMIKNNPEENAYREILNGIENLSQICRQKYTLYNSSTPKVKYLLDIINNAYSESIDSMILIFMKQRISAYFLNKLIQIYLQSIGINIQTGFIIGHTKQLTQKNIKQQDQINIVDSGENDDEETIKQLYNELQKNQKKFEIQELKEAYQNLKLFPIQVNFKQQKETIQQFREGQIKLMVSTSVAEEGIDIPMCNIVIGFNPISSSKVFVQMKGRARKENSQFLIFMVETTFQRAQIISHQSVQQNTRKIIKELVAPQRLSKLQSAIRNLQKKLLNTLYFDSFVIKESNANINTNWSCQLISQFCSSINLEGRTKCSPKYSIYQLQQQNIKNGENNTYIAFLLLPFQIQQFIFYGNKVSTPKDAKASAALEACKKLQDFGYFDAYLKPRFSQDLGLHLGADQDDSQIIMTKEQQQIASKFSINVINNPSWLNLSLNSQKRYYSILDKQFFQNKQIPTEYFIYSCLFRNEKFSLISTSTFYEEIKSIQHLLTIRGIIIKEIQQINESLYMQYYQKYMEELILQEDLIEAGDGTFTQINQQYSFKFINKSNLNFTFIYTGNQKLKNYSILFELILIFKVYGFSQKLKKVNSQQEEFELYDFSLTPNKLLQNLNQYDKQLSSFRFGFQNQISIENDYQIYYSADDNLNQHQIDNFFALQNLNQILFKSLNLQNHQYHDMLLGDSYLKFLISINLYINYYSKDSRILDHKQKYLTRSTYVRNCLLEHHIFHYLHKKVNIDEFSKIFPGMYQNIEYMEKQKQQILQNKLHLSNQDFLCFVQVSLAELEKIDQYQQYGLQWLRILNITNEMKLKIPSSLDLLKLIPLPILNSDSKLDVLKKVYKILQERIKYQFKSFELLFQSMTDIGFKFIINTKVQPKYNANFNYKDEYAGEILETIIDEWKTQYDVMNSIDSSNYENSFLSKLGKSLWNYLTVKYLTQQNIDDISLKVIGKILTGTRFLAYSAIKLGIHEFLNMPQLPSLQELIQQIQKMKDQSITFHIQQIAENQLTVTLTNAFLSLVAAIFLDSSCNLQIVQIWQKKIFEIINCQKLLSQDFLSRQPMYIFMNWYKQKIGNPFDFNLIKIPHTDYKKINQGEQLFIPYDMRKAEIVNILQDKFYDITQLHIWSKSKSHALLKLYEMVDK